MPIQRMNRARLQALADPGFSFGGPRVAPKARVSRPRVSMRRRRPGVGVWGGAVPIPRKFLDLFASEWCILRAF